MTVKLLFFAGSKRANSLNKRLARAAMKKAADFDAEVMFIDLKDFDMPIYCGDLEQDEGVPEAAVRLAEIVKDQDGVFIATPEYNSSITPLLKNTLDWVSRLKTGGGDGVPPQTPWQGRYYSVGATSMGATGGIRGVQGLTHLLINGYQLQVSPKTVAVPKGSETLSEDGDVTNPQIEAMLLGSMKHFVETAAKLSA